MSHNSRRNGKPPYNAPKRAKKSTIPAKKRHTIKAQVIINLIPIKESGNRKLDKREKAFNKRLSRERVAVEHVNAKIKTFKVMAYPYRNRLRMSSPEFCVNAHAYFPIFFCDEFVYC